MAASLWSMLPIALLVACQPKPDVTELLQALPHQVLHDDRTHVRPAGDRHYNHWTQDPAKASELLQEFGITLPGFQLLEGQILVVLLNDNIHEDLDRIVFHKTRRKTFADYLDSGMEFKLRDPPEGKKYSHLTVVVFTPVVRPGHIGMRCMKIGGLSIAR